MSNIEWGTETDKKLEQIAMKADYALEQRGGLDTRSNDTEDFPEVSVWGILQTVSLSVTRPTHRTCAALVRCTIQRHFRHDVCHIYFADIA